MDIWNDQEERQNRKRRKIMRQAASSIGGAVGLFMLKYIIPDFDNVDVAVVQSQLNLLALWALVYGLSMAVLFAFRQQAVIPVNGLMVWILTPCVILYTVMNLSAAING